MTRDQSDLFKSATFAPETDEVFIVLLTITHDDLGNPIYLCNNTQAITSRGKKFLAFPMMISLPDDRMGSPCIARITVCNVTRELIPAIRELDSSPSVTLEVVMASTPDTVEAEFPDFTLRNVKYDVNTIEFDLSVEDWLIEPFPAGIFHPGAFPGLFS